MIPEKDSPKNWTEDYQHENGKYICHCVKCDGYFFGYKRRVVCKECATHSHPTLPSDEVTAEEFIREKIREKLKITGRVQALWKYSVNAEDCLRWAHEYASARIAEMEMERKEFKKLARLIGALNEDHDDFKCIAGHIQLARKLLTTTTP